MKAAIRTTLLTFVLMHVLALFFSVSAEEAPLPNPVGAWNLTEGEGKKAIDVSGNQRDGEFGDDETGWIQDFEGKFTNVVTPGFINIDNNDGKFNAGEDFTFATWLYVSENHSGWGMIANHVSTNANAQWDMHINTEGNLAIEAQGVWGPQGLLIVKYNFIEEPKWRHVAVTFKKDTKTFEVFIDGVQFKDIRLHGITTEPAVVAEAIEAPSGSSTFKLLGQDTGFNNLIGRIAQVRLYDQVLSAGQINQLMVGDNLGVEATPTPSEEVEASETVESTPTPDLVVESDGSAEPEDGSAIEPDSETISSSTDDSSKSSGLYIGIVIVIVVVLGVLAVIAVRRKKRN